MVWSIQHIRPIPTQMNFSHSGEDQRSVTAIQADGDRLINALEFVEFDADATQVLVCEGCGHSQCAPGGWISFRRLVGENAVIGIPAWSLMENDESEFSPPSILVDRGLPVLNEREWEQIRRSGEAFPPISSLRPLNSHEAARLMQESAPSDILGQLSNPPRLNRGMLDAVVEGDLDAQADAVDAHLHEMFTARYPVTRVLDDRDVKPVDFITSIHDDPLWTALVELDGELCPSLDGLLLKRASESRYGGPELLLT